MDAGERSEGNLIDNRLNIDKKVEGGSTGDMSAGQGTWHRSGRGPGSSRRVRHMRKTTQYIWALWDPLRE